MGCTSTKTLQPEPVLPQDHIQSQSSHTSLPPSSHHTPEPSRHLHQQPDEPGSGGTTTNRTGKRRSLFGSKKRTRTMSTSGQHVVLIPSLSLDHHGTTRFSKNMQKRPVCEQYLAHSPFFVYLSPEQLALLASVFTVRDFDRQVHIFRQGSEFSSLLVVAEGEVEVETEVDGRMLKCTQGSGYLLGSEVVKRDVVPSARATVRTLTSCKCVSVDQEVLHEFLDAHQDMRSKVEAVLSLDMPDMLRRVPFLCTLADRELRLLSSLLRYCTVQQDCMLFDEGSLGTSLYILLSGTCAAVHVRKVEHEEAGDAGAVLVTEGGETATPDQMEEKVLNTFRQGDYFGETALMLGMPRTAAIKSLSRSLLVEIRKENFESFLAVVPHFRSSFERLAKKRIAASFRKYKVPFFDSIPQDKYSRLAELCVIHEFQEGHVVFREGDAGNDFYLVAFGDLSVTVESGGKCAEVATMKPGDYFGEIALVKDTLRGATVTCRSRAVLLSISKSNFALFFREVPEAIADFQVKLARYDVSLQVLVYHPVGLQFFTRYLCSEFSSENIEFWKQARAWRQLYDSSCVLLEDEEEEPGDNDTIPAPALQNLTQEANRIVNEFVRPTASVQVNLQAHVQHELITKVEGSSIGRDLFLEAQTEIVRLMETDSFARFKQSPLFQEFLAQANAYEHVAEDQKSKRKLSTQFTKLSEQDGFSKK